jgi:hypothetical protein
LAPGLAFFEAVGAGVAVAGAELVFLVQPVLAVGPELELIFVRISFRAKKSSNDSFNL